MKKLDSKEDRVTLLVIQAITQLNYGSDQSRLYLDEAKKKLRKELVDESKDDFRNKLEL